MVGIIKTLQKLIIWLDKSKGADETSAYMKRKKGKFYILYTDYNKSVNMDYYSAKEYTNTFGGLVYHERFGEVL